MTDDLDDPLAALSAALDVDPSPEFAASVRTRIQDELRVRQQRWWLVAAGITAVVVLMVWVRISPAPHVPPSQVAAISESAPDVAVAPAPPRDGPAQLELRRVVQRDRARDVIARREPEVLIAPDQAIAFQRLVKAVYEGRIVAPNPNWPKFPALEEGAEPPAVEVLPVEVKPIVIDPLVIDTMPDQEG